MKWTLGCGSIGSMKGLYRDNGKEMEATVGFRFGVYIGLILYRDNGKENGNYYIIIGVYRNPTVETLDPDP